VLNNGVLPEGYYALAEQVGGGVYPDVLTLERSDTARDADDQDSGGIATAKARPRATISENISEAMLLAARRRRMVIRHSSDNRMVALIELVSPGNKEKRSAMEDFLDKAVAILDDDYHLLVVDLFPCGRTNPTGMHGAVWKRLGGKYSPPESKPLTLASYFAKRGVTCFVELVNVGMATPSVPLFLGEAPEEFVDVPLEQSYMAAFAQMPGHVRKAVQV